jgi:ABC-2 type transport system ATP-binding protein
MIHVSQLVKYYNGLKALEDVSFHVAEGEIFGLLGPNGAGKTTLVGILTTEIKPTNGTARIKGIDVVNDPLAVKHLIGVVPQHRSQDRKLTGRGNMLVMARAYGVKNPSRRVEELLALVGLADRAESRIREFS